MTDDLPQKRDLETPGHAPPADLPTNTTAEPSSYQPADYGKIMAQSKKKRQSKTWLGIVAGVLGSLATLAGISVEFGWLADGLQFSDIAIGVTTIATIFAWAVTQWGQRTATKPIRGYE